MPDVVGSILIRTPRERVFDFVTTPSTWPRWYPITRAVTGSVDHPALPGDEWVEEVKLGVWHGFFHWRALERDRPNRFHYEGTATSPGLLGKISSGGLGKITYVFTEQDGGTLFNRELDYSSPNLLMAIFDKLDYHKHIVEASSQALQNLKDLLESGPAPTSVM